jgi:enoyl-CoA hydratase
MDFVKREVRDYIAYITIDRPPANALTRQAYSELSQAFNELNDMTDEVRVVILTGEGKHFIAGNDVNDFDGATKSEMNVQGGYFGDCLWSIYNCPVPIIGAINGTAVGAGFCIAAVCDVLIASEKARFGVPEIKVGVLGGLSFLPLMVPQKVGKYMSLTGNLIPASQMVQYGALHAVVPQEELLVMAEQVAKEILAGPPLALCAWKKAYNLIENLHWMDTEHITDIFVQDLIDTEDGQEAVRAFLEKRPPVYKGR